MLLSKPVIETSLLLSAAKQGLGRSVTKLLDARQKDINTTASYLAILAEMKSAGSDPSTILDNPGHLLSHAFYAFLVISNKDTLIEILQESRLAIHSVECVNGLQMYVVSGTLENWRSTIINGCSSASSYLVRALLDQCLLVFEKEGLGRVWSHYSKRVLPDQTFLLEQKK